MVHILGQKPKDIPITREVKIYIPQDLVDFIEKEIKANVSGMCNKLIKDMLYQAKEELEKKREESKKDSKELAKKLVNAKDGEVMNVNINK